MSAVGSQDNIRRKARMFITPFLLKKPTEKTIAFSVGFAFFIMLLCAVNFILRSCCPIFGHNP